MVDGLVLSIFPGIDLLGMAFEQEDYCVVKGPDVIFGGDIRSFHPPPGVFEGVIGGPPCQGHSSCAEILRHKGRKPSFPDMTPEYVRVVREAAPDWFLYENVRRAPKPEDLAQDGYSLQPFLLNNRHVDAGDGVGPVQNRVRLIVFGDRAARTIKPALAALDNPRKEWAVLASELKAGARDRFKYSDGIKRVAGTFRNRNLEQICELQGLPKTFNPPGWTKDGKGHAVGNGVPLFMGRALARAIRVATRCASEVNA